jgi:hypothetical protein
VGVVVAELGAEAFQQGEDLQGGGLAGVADAGLVAPDSAANPTLRRFSNKWWRAEAVLRRDGDAGWHVVLDGQIVAL